MLLSKVIQEQESAIKLIEKELATSIDRRNKLVLLYNQFPNAHYERGAISLNDIWDKTNCMRIEWKYSYSNNSPQIVAKFSPGKRTAPTNVPKGLKIYTAPYINTIAEMKHSYARNGSSNTRIRELLVFDYKAMIPDICPKKKAFLNRIRMHLVNLITMNKMILLPNSFNFDELQRLAMIR